MKARARSAIAATLAAAALFGGSVAAAQPPGRYVVEFRARPGGVFGHTYVAYGRIDHRGRLVHPRYAGFYPGGLLSDTPLLALLATPSRVSVEPRDRMLRSDLVYRREIGARTYARFASEIRTLGRERPLWHLTFYNCNSFAGDVAQWLGMQVPPALQMPRDFVRALYVLNRRSRRGEVYAAATGTAARTVAQSPDMLFLRAIADPRRPGG